VQTGRKTFKLAFTRTAELTVQILREIQTGVRHTYIHMDWSDAKTGREKTGRENTGGYF
jgi:hypothetical protein